MQWRSLAPLPCDAESAIAQSDALLRSLRPDDPPHLVIWAVERPTVVLGRGGASDLLDRLACDHAGIPVVTRPTGGGPLLWDKSMMAFDVLLPKGHVLETTDVVESYRFVGEAIVAALAQLDIVSHRMDPDEARTAAREDDHPAGSLCFGGKSPHEVLCGKRKIAGLAQARRATGTLIQGGILVTDDHLRLADLISHPEVDRVALDARTVSIASANGAIPWSDITVALTACVTAFR